MTPRSGSTWLSLLLGATGAMGRPTEYFAFEHAFARGSQSSTLEDYLEEVKAHSATENGVYGIKANFVQLAPLVRRRLLLPDERCRYVYLTREDLVMQGISLYRAATTGSWTGRAKGEPPPAFDPLLIERRVVWLIAMMAAWERLFAAYGIQPLRLTYEEIERDPMRCVERVASYIEVPFDPSSVPAVDPIRRQRDATSEEWAETLTSMWSRTQGRAPGPAERASTAHQRSRTRPPPGTSRDALRGVPPEIARMAADRARLERAVRELSAEVDLYRSSTSWRLTEPLRTLGARVPVPVRRLAQRVSRTRL